VRYGLADDLLRHSRNEREFLHALSEFLTDYSKENARVMERAKGKGYRKRIPISTEDISQLTELKDKNHVKRYLLALTRDQRHPGHAQPE
jgi:hypothetical protein